MSRHALLVIAGVVLTGLIWSGIWYFWNKPMAANATKGPPAAATPQIPASLTMTPAEIIAQSQADELAGQDSFGMQPRPFGAQFEGMYVVWELYLVPNSVTPFSAIDSLDDIQVRCTDTYTDFDGGNSEILGILVTLNTTSTDHAFLNFAFDAKQKFTVSGYIQRVETSHIWLDNADIQPVSSSGWNFFQ